MGKVSDERKKKRMERCGESRAIRGTERKIEEEKEREAEEGVERVAAHTAVVSMVSLRAGVIIYLAAEIGPADIVGRFNGRTMLELTKTKTKHQLGDFFFHFASPLRSLPPPRPSLV